MRKVEGDFGGKMSKFTVVIGVARFQGGKK